MLNFNLPELGVILVIALIVFGPGKLPEAGKALGKGLRELRQAVSGESSNVINVEGKSTESKPGETQ
ncbi:Sec-independent protein translocase subunit TatA/TatB [Sporomusa acidovorans]|uniref:Sec-independent protein translocase protein TatA n=1 Tax=Sporomusa acidovorans (strain ATCC 49682 / DSM 3132 / Mol) TaxID=1123286 RepID=A0ABZ3JAC5_SPOA4|nr:twin-arginine translocase TatA/TatE family subunit [Sporomusa acidovorans]OZC21844.1 Sec-independent protein translocase protein TatAy [Sporomusa acidovorans DSM 3132]SDD55163.1 sec-independent protein translocase protein TatA [Sporomusa acidovorans]